MNSRTLLTERLPSDLLARMIVHAGGGAWPVGNIPAVIEACRVAGLTSLGGDLQVQTSEGLWESPNLGVTIFQHELALADETLADQTAAIASQKFAGLNESEMVAEVVAGCPGAAGWSRDEILSRLAFSWTVVAPACSPPPIA